MKRNYYDILNLKSDCSDNEIKKSFRKLAIKYHPDKNSSPDSSEKFREINEAYETLGNIEKRRNYDAVLNRTYITDDFIKNFTYDFSPDLGMSEAFDAMFSSLKMDRGSDVLREINVSFVEAYCGTWREIMVDDKKYRIDIQPGTCSGMSYRYKGEGTKGKKTSGDLLVKIKVIENDKYRVEKENIHIEQTVDIFTFITGGTTDIELPDTTVKIKIPRNTLPSKIFRISGKGLLKNGRSNTRGDIYIHFVVEIPNINEEDIELIEKIKTKYAKRTDSTTESSYKKL